jgi:hypothetical protein
VFLRHSHSCSKQEAATSGNREYLYEFFQIVFDRPTQSASSASQGLLEVYEKNSFQGVAWYRYSVISYEKLGMYLKSESEMSEQSDRERNRAEKGGLSLQATIAGLKLCNEAQNELITNFESYQRKVMGGDEDDDSETQRAQQAYGAELGYLQARRKAVDSLIAAVERYTLLADALTSDALNSESRPQRISD